jgi:serine/threonine protein kinase
MTHAESARYRFERKISSKGNFGDVWLAMDTILDIARGVLHALRYAHGEGVVHRDVKPGNVMLTYTEPDVKLLDSGLADQVHPATTGRL